MTLQRHLCGGIGILLLAAGAVLYARESASVVLTATLLRAGCLLVVTWLAWPQLERNRKSIPRVVIVSGVLLAAILVARPSLGKIAGLITAVVIGVSMLGRWISFLGQKR